MNAQKKLAGYFSCEFFIIYRSSALFIVVFVVAAVLVLVLIAVVLW